MRDTLLTLLALLLLNAAVWGPSVYDEIRRWGQRRRVRAARAHANQIVADIHALLTPQERAQMDTYIREKNRADRVGLDTPLPPFIPQIRRQSHGIDGQEGQP